MAMLKDMRGGSFSVFDGQKQQVDGSGSDSAIPFSKTNNRMCVFHSTITHPLLHVTDTTPIPQSIIHRAGEQEGDLAIASADCC